MPSALWGLAAAWLAALPYSLRPRFCCSCRRHRSLLPSCLPRCCAAPALWINSKDTPAWVEGELARMDSGAQ